MMYKVELARNEWRGNDTARLNISVGQEYHEGQKLEVTVDWLNRHFKAVVINVCDTLQRYNTPYLANAHDHARAKGDEWLLRNRLTLDKLTNKQIIRWDDWLKHPDYPEAIKRIIRLYNDDIKFTELIDDTAKQQASKRNGVTVRDSLNYIIEETAIAMIMGQTQIADIYPGSYMPVMDYLQEAGLPTLQSMTRLNFKRRKPKAA